MVLLEFVATGFIGIGCYWFYWNWLPFGFVGTGCHLVLLELVAIWFCLNWLLFGFV